MHTSVRGSRRWRRCVVGAVAGLGLVAQAGATLADKTPDLTLMGKAAQAQFGAQLNAQVDLNKDGYRDLIVGNPGGPDFRGSIDVFYGSKKGPSKTAGFHYEGPMAWAQVGYSPQAVDVNGDGWPDLVVGADNYSGAQQYAGAVMVFLGSSAGFPAQPTQIIEGPSTNSFFGLSVKSLGDFNADGYADVVVNAMGANGSLGQLTVYEGSPSGLKTTPVNTLNGAPPWIYFGRVIDTGDVDGDGIVDLLVGKTSPTGGIPGMVNIYRGTRTGYASSAWQTLLPVEQDDGDWFADTVTFLGDVDGDGFGDVGVSAPRHVLDLVSGGIITVYYGAAGGPGASGRTQIVRASGGLTYFGSPVLGARDMNGDGYADLVVGTPAYARPFLDTDPFPGQVWVYGGSATGLRTDRIYKLNGTPGSRDELGTSLEAADLNGDGRLDLVAGSSQYTGTLAAQGRVQIFAGTAKTSPKPATAAPR